MDLVLHIGLPKTATTFLQREVFVKHPYYSGNVDPSYYEELKETFRILVMDNSSMLSHFLAWSNELYELHRQNGNSSKCILHSDEGVCEYNYGNSHVKLAKHPFKIDYWGKYRSYSAEEPPPIFSLLDQLSNKTWSYGDVRVILTLRNQVDWLGSLYAQLSNKILNASQDDFERQVNRIIQENNDYIDWSRWVDRLQQLLGKKNVCVLLTEELKTDRYWKDLLDFIDLEGKKEDFLVEKNQMRHNKRNKAPGVWKIRPSKSIAKYTIKKWPDNVAPKARRIADRINMKSSPVYEPIYKYIYDRKRGNEIMLTDEIKEKIYDYTRPFNEKLEKQLGRDLKSLGY